MCSVWTTSMLQSMWDPLYNAITGSGANSEICGDLRSSRMRRYLQKIGRSFITTGGGVGASDQVQGPKSTDIGIVRIREGITSPKQPKWASENVYPILLEAFVRCPNRHTNKRKESFSAHALGGEKYLVTWYRNSKQKHKVAWGSKQGVLGSAL